MKKLNYNKLKQIKKDNRDEINLVKTIYSQETGEMEKEVEEFFDPTLIPNRITALQEEISKLQDLQGKVEREEFDEVEDKRSNIKK